MTRFLLYLVLPFIFSCSAARADPYFDNLDPNSLVFKKPSITVDYLAALSALQQNCSTYGFNADDDVLKRLWAISEYQFRSDPAAPDEVTKFTPIQLNYESQIKSNELSGCVAIYERFGREGTDLIGAAMGPGSKKLSSKELAEIDPSELLAMFSDATAASSACQPYAIGPQSSEIDRLLDIYEIKTGLTAEGTGAASDSMVSRIKAEGRPLCAELYSLYGLDGTKYRGLLRLNIQVL